MDQIARQALVSKLQGHMKKASSNVQTSLVAEKDDFKVVLSSKDLKQYYKGIEVASTKVAELDDDVIEFINGSPDDAAQEMLEGFRQSFDEEAFNRAAESNKKTEKTAAHATQDESTHDMVTQKQFDEQKPSLHPRTDEYYSNVTQKQLPEHGQRPGTYDQVTEGQFRDERTTFYGADRTAGDWKQEDRNTVTERQFEEGTKEYSDVGESDRGEMGSKFDGGVEQQWRVIGEKQLMELLKHHEWTEPLTTTEGPDQLQQQDGELSRLTADVARNIVKEALQALGNTVASAGVTPQDLSGIVRRLVSHPSKYPVLANVIRCYTGADTSAIEKKVAKARYFGKVANADRDFSDNLIADVFMRQLSAMNYNPQFIVDGLVALAESEDIEERIDSACEQCLKGKPVTDEKKAENVDIFRTVISGKEEVAKDEVAGDDSDGFYSYEGPLTEVNASLNDKDEFKKAATDFARERILVAAEKEIDLIPQSLDVNNEDGTYVIVFYDPTHKEAELKARAEARRKLVKEADTKEAQMGGAGGMPPAAGPEMGNPMAPPGGGDMGAPPAGEALSQEPPMPDDGMGDGGGGGGEPQPPGTVCTVCGSQDVDVDNGEFRCNNCGAEGDIYVDIHVKKWPGTIEESESDEGEGFGLGAEEELGDLGAPGDEMGEGAGTTLPNVPVGASVKDVLTKLASKDHQTVFASKFRITPRTAEVLKDQKIQIGSVCPNCGSNNTDSTKIAGGKAGICWSCGQEYKWRVLANRNKKNSVVGQYIWSPKTAEENCSGCNRLREAFDEALKEYGVTREEFDNLGDITAQAPFVLKLAKAGALDGLVDVMQEDLPLNKVAASARWKGSEKFDKFPSASCLERIARRFGENATAMSGPCEGKNLAKCVCTQLEGLGIYSDGVAAKVAKTLLDENPMVNNPMKTCVAMLVRDGMDMDDACVACDGLRAAHADVDDLVIEAIAQFAPAEMSAKPMAPKPMAQPKPMAPKPMAQPKPMTAPTDGMKPMAPKPMAVQPGEATMPMSEPEGPVADPTMIPNSPGVDQGKPMPEPMNEPITDATEIGGDLPGGEMVDVEVGIEPGIETGFGDEMGEGFDDGFGGMDNESLGLEIGEGTVTIQLPDEAVDALQVLFDALQGQIGDEFAEEIPTDDGLDVGDITEETVDETDEISEEGSEESEEGGIPGLADDDSTPEGDFGGDEVSEEESDESEPMLNKHTEDKDCGAKPCGKPMPMSDDNSHKMEAKPMRNNQEVVAPVAESDVQMQKEAQVQPQEGHLESMLLNMKRGSLRTTQSALDNLFDGIMRQAEQAKTAADNDVKKMDYKGGDEGSKVNVTPAQDSSEVKFKDGGKIGHEESFTDGVANSPDVPRAAATMGDEDSSNTVNESSDLPSVPHGSPAMAGEEHYRPEKGNVVDGNQGSQSTSAKSQKTTKTAKSEEKTMKVANTVWTVQKDHQHYDALHKKASAGDWVVKLQDGKTYDMSADQNGNFVLVAQNSSEIKKESQSVTPNKVDTLVDDPDINQKSGPGKGKTHADESHSLAVTEKKPSEGMDEPSVPEAENKGQLTREHTYDNELDGPEIPAGGGMNPDYDENEKNTPEKQDQMLGKQDGGAALASHDEAVKIAGQMVKANLISIDELPAKVQELSKVPTTALKDYERLIQVASSKKGLQKESSAGAVETAFVQKTAATDEQNLKDDIQSLFRLDQRNRDHEKWSQDKGNSRLFH